MNNDRCFRADKKNYQLTSDIKNIGLIKQYKHDLIFRH